MNFLVNLDVDDLDKAARFYASAFELKIGRRFGAFAVEMLGSSTPIYLLVKSPGTPASDTTSQGRSYERHWTPIHLDFVVDEDRTGGSESGIGRSVAREAHRYAQVGQARSYG